MTDIDPIHQLTTTYATDDLRDLVGRPGPFLTVMLPSPSELDDAEHRLDVRWRNARRAVEEMWPADRLADLDDHLASIDHAGGEAVVVIQASDGMIHTEFLAVGLDGRWSSVDPLPRLAVLIENRQRTLPHIQVECDRAGAEIAGFDGGAVVDATTVEGETEHIHRGHPGGWSQRRFQQRAENTWERNAESVADAVGEMAERVGPVLVAVAGEVRARSMVLDALDDRTTVEIEAGDPDGIAGEVLTAVADAHARFQREALEHLRSGDHLTDPGEVVDALTHGRVETLLVADRPLEDDPDSGRTEPDAEPRPVDQAIAAALESSARIVVVPATPEMTGGVAATTRW